MENQEMTCKTASMVEECGIRITDVLVQLHKLAHKIQQSGSNKCANRALLASGFLCLATLSLGGMSGKDLTDKIVELHYLLTHIDCKDCSTCTYPHDIATNRANRVESRPAVN